MDPKELMAQLQALGKRVEELVSKKDQDSIKKDELEKTIEAYLQKSIPAKPSMVLPGDAKTIEEAQALVLAKFEDFKRRPNAYEKAAPWTSEYGKKFGNMQGFLKALVLRSGDLKASTDAMTEGTGSSGGHLVPTEFSYEVIRLLYANTIVRRIGRLVPMSTWKRTLPRQTSNLTVYWVAEFGSKTASKPAFEQVTQQAKVMAAVIKSSDELLRDNAVNLQTFLAELVAGAMAREEERVALVGSTDAGDPFKGVYYETGVVSNTMGGASLEFDDLIDMQASLGEAYQQGAIFVLKRAGLKLIMKLKDGNGQPIWNGPREGAPGMILGKPYELSDQLPVNLGVGGDMTPILYGDFKHLWISDREGIVVKASQDASDWVGGALDSSFMSDQTWLRFCKAGSINVMVPAAFAKMPVK